MWHPGRPVRGPPSMSTVKSVAATRSMRSRTARIARLDPIRGAAPSTRFRLARLRPCALDLQNERGDVGRRVEELARPPVEHTRGLEHRLQTLAMMRTAPRHVEAHHVGFSRRSRVFAECDGVPERASATPARTGPECGVSRDPSPLATAANNAAALSTPVCGSPATRIGAGRGVGRGSIGGGRQEVGERELLRA